MAGPAAATNGTATGGGKYGPKTPEQLLLEAEHDRLSHYLFVILGALAVILIIWRVTVVIVKYVRHVTALNNDTQRYFAIPNTKFAWVKRNLLYSPIWSKRHNREFQLSSAVNMGTLPTRMQLVLLAAYFGTNVAFCLIGIPFSSGDFTTTAKQLRNRSGVLATVNMIPLFLFAGRNNPLIPLLGISFDTYNLLHRWLGRIVILEALCHTFAHWIPNARDSGWDFGGAVMSSLKVQYMMWGFMATVAFFVIGLQAMSPLRHAFYETFKILHIALAALSVVGLFYHLQIKGLPHLKYMYPVIVLWILDRAARALRIVYANFGKGGTQTLVEALPGNACRITVTMARPWEFKPGQHAYLYLPTIGLWQSHPFSVAWSEEAENLDDEKLAMTRQDVLSMRKTTMSFVIRGRTGMTGALYRKAAACEDGRMQTRCFVEGPYGGLHSMSSYGTVMLFAGGVGITQAVPHVRDLVIGYSNNTVATRKIVLVWIIQSPEHLEWIRPWMTEILAMEKRREVLRIMLFVSRPRSTKEIHSPSATVQMFPGRPNIDRLLDMEMEQQLGCMAVSVCGPGSLSDEVRCAVRQKQYHGSIDFVEEAFSW